MFKIEKMLYVQILRKIITHETLKKNYDYICKQTEK